MRKFFIVAVFVIVAMMAPVALAVPDLLSRPDVQKSIQAIYDDTFVKHLPFELALLVRQDSVDFTSGVRGDVFFPFDSGILAVIHTHPDTGYEKPSQQDVQTAIKLKVPIYVISLRQTWVVDYTGAVRQVQ